MTAIDISWKVYPNGIAYELLRHELADDIEQYAAEQLQAVREENERLKQFERLQWAYGTLRNGWISHFGACPDGCNCALSQADEIVNMERDAALNRPAAVPAVGKGGGEKG